VTPNIKIQRSGPRISFVHIEPLPAADLGVMLTDHPNTGGRFDDQGRE
jgi:hypothetical protein